ncbi:unnamed protein product [Hyaloperonospora brassicae]|uniref:Molybdate ABC transporter substrate-binding protein n=1 Tax=Hyaloperonospora brassicae TaxID=162125 RepID=A0AAV0SYY3_HYABA|nr:unnamed protein product [Hyaloperonospora brassicae]
MTAPAPPIGDKNALETPYKRLPAWSGKLKNVRYRLALMAVLAALLAGVILMLYNGIFSSSSSSSQSNDSSAATSDNVVVYLAASLTELMNDDLSPAFTAATGVTPSFVAKGSVKLANLLANGSQSDLFISADASVNTALLMGNGNNNLISWYITFGATSIGLGYSRESPYADVFAAVQNGSLLWYEALQQNPNMKIGRTDPEVGPKGYRTVMMLELAEKYYNTTGLAMDILGSATNRDQIFSEEQLATSVMSGDLDVGFFYAVEVGSLSNVDFIALPSEINMGSLALDDTYATVSYTNSATGTVYNGSATVYTVTILNSAPRLSEAEAFVTFLLSPDGRRILTKQGVEATAVVAYGNTSAIPATVAAYL